MLFILLILSMQPFYFSVLFNSNKFFLSLLGPQILLACKFFLPNTPIVSSYHTNIAFYAKMFGFSMLYEPIWATHRLYHGSSKYVLCPSYSTREALAENGIPASKVLVWSRGVDNALFSPLKRNESLRKSWFCNTVKKINTPGPVSRALSSTTSSMSMNLLSNRRSSSSSINTGELDKMIKFEDEGVAFDNNQDKVVLLYVGRISWEKNLRVLVESFKKMNHDEYHLVIVGDGPAKQTIQSQLESTGGVTFTGYLKGEHLAEAYASADIFAFPSVSETFGQVVLEAQASGLPVVGMQAEGVKEIVADGVSGILVNPNNDENKVIHDYHNAILQISSDYKTHNSMSKQALVRSQKFTWNAAMETCINAYKNAINQN